MNEIIQAIMIYYAELNDKKKDEFVKIILKRMDHLDLVALLLEELEVE